MRCRACRKRLSAYLDGELPASDRERVETHLASCPRCSAARDRTEQAMAAVDRLPSVEPSDGFDAAFARKLQQAEQRAADAPRRRRGSWLLGDAGWRWPAVATLGAAAAIVAITVSVHRMQRPDLLEPPAIASDLEIVRSLDMLRDYEVVSRLDGLQDYDVVANLDRLIDAEQQGEQP